MKKQFLFSCIVMFGALNIFAQTPYDNFAPEQSVKSMIELSKLRFKLVNTDSNSEIRYAEFDESTFFLSLLNDNDSVIAKVKINPNDKKFLTPDPLAEKFPNVSPYAYCFNNPVRYTDPTGMYPVYDPDGNLLGTDDNGLQGHAIIMNKDNFKQGMSYEDAMKHNLGLEGLANQDAVDRYTSSFDGLKDRPDWDGYLTLSEANDWYQNGNGQPLFVDLNKIDLSEIYSLGEKYVGQVKTVNLLRSSNNVNDGLVYGNITLKRYPNHTVRAFADTYDFDMKSWGNLLNWGRNVETIIGQEVAGQGTGYSINIYGSKKLAPVFPWTK